MLGRLGAVAAVWAVPALLLAGWAALLLWVTRARRRTLRACQRAVTVAKHVAGPHFEELSPSLQSFNWGYYRWAAVNPSGHPLESLTLSLLPAAAHDPFYRLYSAALDCPVRACVEVRLGDAQRARLRGMHVCAVARREVPVLKARKPGLLVRVGPVRGGAGGAEQTALEAYESCAGAYAQLLGADPEALGAPGLRLLCYSDGTITAYGGSSRPDPEALQSQVRALSGAACRLAERLCAFSPGDQQAAQMRRREEAGAAEERAASAKRRAEEQAAASEARLEEQARKLQDPGLSEADRKSIQRKLDAADLKARMAASRRLLGSQAGGGKGSRKSRTVVVH